MASKFIDPQLVKVDVTSSGGQTEIDEAAPFTYIGKALSGVATSVASWQIQRLEDTGGGDTTILFADGDRDYNNIWDDRVGLSYS